MKVGLISQVVEARGIEMKLREGGRPKGGKSYTFKNLHLLQHFVRLDMLKTKLGFTYGIVMV